MNKRRRKKKDKRSYLGLADEYNLIGMNNEELDHVYAEREKYRKNYGYRKKYKSKRRLRSYFILPTERQSEEFRKIYDLCGPFRTHKVNCTIVKQSLDDITNNISGSDVKL